METSEKKSVKLLPEFTKGIFRENQIFVSLLGLCPALAITKTVGNALGMGLATLIVLVLSNIVISSIRKIVPKEIRIPVFIVVIATFVTMIEMLLKAYIPNLSDSLGIFISLIVVNCIILGRAEAFASKNKVLPSIMDGIGMALGYTLALVVISLVREFLGTGSVTVWEYFKNGETVKIGFTINPKNKLQIFSNFWLSAPGAFIALGMILGIIIAIQNRLKLRPRKEKKHANAN